MPGRGSLAFVVLACVALVTGLVLFLGGGSDRGPRADSVLTVEPAIDAEGDHGSSELAAPDVSLPVAPAPGPVRVAQREEVSSEYEAELAGGHWVEGTVRFPAGTPLDEEAFVIARGRKFESGELHRVRVEPNGAFRVAFSERTRTGRLALEARYVYLEQSLKVDLREGPESPVLEPLLGGRVAGALVPPPGLELKVADLPGLRLWSTDGRNQRGTRVDPELRFELNALPTAEPYQLRFDSDELETLELQGLQLEPGKTLETNLVLHPRAFFAGQVLDEAGAPVEGARVSLGREPEVPPEARFHKQVLSKADGSFRVGGLPGGTLVLDVRKQGYVVARTTLAPLGATERVEGCSVRLERGLRIQGVARWADGTPAVGAKLEVTSETEVGSIVEDWDVDALGAFEITGLLEAPVRLAASATRRVESEEHERVREQVALDDVQPGTTGLVLVFGEGLELSGIVRNEGGEPLPEFRIGTTRLLEYRGGGTRRESGLGKRFDSADGSFTLGGLGPGTWEFQARAKGYADSRAITRTLPDDGRPLEFRLERRGRIRGFVRTPAGAPVARARVRTRIPEHEWTKDGPTVLTEEDGSFELSALAPGVIRLRVQAEGFAPSSEVLVELASAEERTGLELALRVAATVTGEVLRSDGTPDPGRALSLASWDGEAGAEATSDEAGTFRFEGLAPGRYELGVDSDVEDLRARLGSALDETALGLFHRSERLRLAEGETRHVVLGYEDLDLVLVTGHVLVNGAPVPGLQLHFWREGPGDSGSVPRVEAADDGSYSVSVPGPGLYRVSVSHQASGANLSARHEVPAVERHVYDLDLQAGSIAGTVRGADGEPLAGIRVTCDGRGDRDDPARLSVQINSTTESDGTYLISMLPAQEYTVTASESPRFQNLNAPAQTTRADARRAGVRVGPREELRGIDLFMQAGGSLEGRVRSADGTLFSGAWVQACDAAGKSLGLGHGTDAHGRFRLTGLPPGQVTVFATAQGFASPRRAVEIRPGEVASLELDLSPSGMLQVWLRSASGALEKGEVAVEGQPGLRASFARDRSSHVGPLPLGDHTLRITVHGRVITREVTVTAGEPVQVEVRID